MLRRPTANRSLFILLTLDSEPFSIHNAPVCVWIFLGCFVDTVYMQQVYIMLFLYSIRNVFLQIFHVFLQEIRVFLQEIRVFLQKKTANFSSAAFLGSITQ